MLMSKQVVSTNGRCDVSGALRLAHGAGQIGLATEPEPVRAGWFMPMPAATPPWG